MTKDIQAFDFDLAVQELKSKYPELTAQMYVAPASYDAEDSHIEMMQLADYEDYIEFSGHNHVDFERFLKLAYADLPQCVPSIKDDSGKPGGGILTRWNAIATAQELNRFIFDTPAKTYGSAAEHPNVIEDQNNELNMWNWHFFDHEAAHMLSEALLRKAGYDVHNPATACLAENISDIFATLSHMQRFGKTTGFPQKIQMFRAHNVALNIGESYEKISPVAMHYTSPGIRDAIQWAQNHDVNGLSPIGLLNLSMKLAENSAPEASALLKIHAFTRDCGERLEQEAGYITPAFFSHLQQAGAKARNLHIKNICRDFLSWSNKYFPDTAKGDFDFNAAERILTQKQDAALILRKLQAKRNP